MYIDYINLPKIPDELLESKAAIIAKPTAPVKNYNGAIVLSNSITRREVSKNLIEWLQSVCNFQVNAVYLILNSNAPIHRDPRTRPQAYNYIINAGGDNVTTTVYCDNYTVLKSLVIPERTWYCLDTERLHGIHGILKGEQRIVLSINYSIGTLARIRTETV